MGRLLQYCHPFENLKIWYKNLQKNISMKVFKKFASMFIPFPACKSPFILSFIYRIEYGTAYLTRPFSVKTTFVPCFIQVELGVTIEKIPAKGWNCK